MINNALQTGMRKGEIFGLKWPDSDFVSRVITVEGTKSGYIRKKTMSEILTEALQNVRKN